MNIDAAAGSVEELDRIRQRWPEIEILILGDAGFCRKEITLDISPQLV